MSDSRQFNQISKGGILASKRTRSKNAFLEAEKEDVVVSNSNYNYNGESKALYSSSDDDLIIEDNDCVLEESIYKKAKEDEKKKDGRKRNKNQVIVNKDKEEENDVEDQEERKDDKIEPVENNVLAIVKKKKRAVTSVIHLVYEICDDSKKKMCKACKKLISVGIGTSNLRDHIKNKHKGLKVMLDGLDGVSSEKASEAVEAWLSAQLVEKDKMKENFFKSLRVVKKEPHKVANELSLLAWGVSAVVPFNKFEDEWWKRFEVQVGIKLGSRHRLTQLLPVLYKYCEGLILKDIKNAGSYIAITFDMWTSFAHHHVLGVTYHWITPEWKLRSHAIDLLDFGEAPAMAEVIAEVISTRLDARLPNVILSAAVSDRGANVLKARSLLVDENDSEHCVPHLLKSALDDVLTNSASDYFCLKMNKDFQAISSLCIMIKHSGSNRLMLKTMLEPQIAHLHVILDNVTRWEGKYTMVERAIVLKEGLTKMIDDDSIKSLEMPKDFLKNEFWIRMKIYESIMLIFHLFSKRSQEEKLCSKGQVPKWINEVRAKISPSEHCGYFETTLRNLFSRSFENRFGIVTSSVNNTTKAALLDPYSGDLSFMSEELRNLCWKNIEAEAASLSGSLDDNSESNSDLEEERVLLDLQVKRAIKKAKKILEAERIQGKDGDVLEFWKSSLNGPQFHFIHMAVKGILQIPASAAKPERLFSYTGLLINRLSGNFDMDTVQMMALIHDAMITQVLKPEEFDKLVEWVTSQSLLQGL